jgi:hypothetical protein
MLFEIIGWMGAALLLASFFYLTVFNKSGTDRMYLWGNLLGSIGLLTNALYYSMFPFVLVNGFWGIITLVTFFKKSKPDNL